MATWVTTYGYATSLSKKKTKFPRWNTKLRGKRDTTQNIPRNISFSPLYILCYIWENRLGHCTKCRQVYVSWPESLIALGWWPPRIAWVWIDTCSPWTVSPAPAAAATWTRSVAFGSYPTASAGTLKIKKSSLIAFQCVFYTGCMQWYWKF